MKSLEEILKLDNLEELKKEITIRQEARNQMVGQLYPSIITMEINQINLRYIELYFLVKKNMEHILKQEEEWKK